MAGHLSDQLRSPSPARDEFLHPLPVGAAPVEAVALGAEAKCLLGGKDVGRYLPPGLVSGNRLQEGVADGAAAEGRLRLDAQFVVQLAKLVLERFALDQEEGDIPAASQVEIAGQEDAILCPSDAH